MGYTVKYLGEIKSIVSDAPDLSKKYSQLNGTLGRICWVTFLKQRLCKSRERVLAQIINSVI